MFTLAQFLSSKKIEILEKKKTTVDADNFIIATGNLLTVRKKLILTTLRL